MTSFNFSNLSPQRSNKFEISMYMFLGQLHLKIYSSKLFEMSCLEINLDFSFIYCTYASFNICGIKCIKLIIV